MKRLLFLWLALAAMARAQASPTVLVLRGGTLIDVASGKEIRGSIIVIRGERIKRFRPTGLYAYCPTSKGFSPD